MHHEFLPQGHAVNSEYYLEAKRRLRETIRQKRIELWKNHDNAPADKSLLVREFLAKNETVIMPQLPYSPDLGPADFFLFPELKTPITKKAYCYDWGDKRKIKIGVVSDITKNVLKEWKKRWHKCIISKGGYFKEDKIIIDK